MGGCQEDKEERIKKGVENTDLLVRCLCKTGFLPPVVAISSPNRGIASGWENIQPSQ